MRADPRGVYENGFPLDFIEDILGAFRDMDIQVPGDYAVAF